MTKTRADTGTMPPPPAEDLARTPPSVLAFLERLEDLVIKLSARIEELESRLNNDSPNSNKPPSPYAFRFGFGAYVHVLLTELCGVHGMSRESAQMLLKAMYNLPISQGGIQKCLDRTSQAMLPHYEAIRDAAHKVEVNYIDETAWRRFGLIGSGLYWLWIMISRKVAYFSITKM